MLDAVLDACWCVATTTNHSNRTGPTNLEKQKGRHILLLYQNNIGRTVRIIKLLSNVNEVV